MRIETQKEVEKLLSILSQKELTPEEQETVDKFKTYLEERSQYFIISSIHRDDLANKDIDGSNVDDGVMATLASKMSYDYREQLFEISMEIIATEGLGIPRISDKLILFSPDDSVNESPFDEPDLIGYDDICEKVGPNPMIIGENDKKQSYIVSRDAIMTESNINHKAIEHWNESYHPTPISIYGNCLVCKLDNIGIDKRVFNFYTGQKVWWNDPDEGQSSDYYTIYEVREDSVVFKESDTEVPFHELEIRS